VTSLFPGERVRVDVEEGLTYFSTEKKGWVVFPLRRERKGRLYKQTTGKKKGAFLEHD